MSSSLRRVLLLKSHLTHVRVSPCRGISSEASQAVLSTRKQINIEDSFMSYLDTGATSPTDKTVLFLHGNPTAAYLWRNIIPHVQGVARCVAPDLIGMGHSGQEPNNQYHFRDHYKYLCAWIEKMNFSTKLNLVIHDWGSGLGFHYANQHRDKIASITFMEAMVGVVPGWEAFPDVSRKAFQNLRSSNGDIMVLQKNFFVEKLLPMAIQRELSIYEMEEYRRPYKEPGESRRPTLTWPREIPVRGDGPQDVIDIVDSYRSWLMKSADLPKLYIDADPGFFSAGSRDMVAKWPNIKVVKAAGLHFLQEDSPDTIGQAIKEFITKDV